MSANKSRNFLIVITCIIIMIIIYLFANVSQPYVSCSKTTTNDFGIRIVEEINTIIENNKISKIDLNKTIVLPDKYLEDSSYLESIKSSLEKHYQYLGDRVNYKIIDDRIIYSIVIENKETLIFNNIHFLENDKLEIKINSNTRSSNVVTLSIGDKYTEGKFMIKMKNNGYLCK